MATVYAVTYLARDNIVPFTSICCSNQWEDLAGEDLKLEFQTISGKRIRLLIDLKSEIGELYIATPVEDTYRLRQANGRWTQLKLVIRTDDNVRDLDSLIMTLKKFMLELCQREGQMYERRSP